MKSCCAKPASLVCAAKRSPGQASNQQLCGQNDARPGCAGTSCTNQCRSLKSFRAEFSWEKRVHGVENRVRIRTRFFANGCPTAKCERDDSQLRQSSGLLS